jgi:hypothetical protein
MLFWGIKKQIAKFLRGLLSQLKKLLLRSNSSQTGLGLLGPKLPPIITMNTDNSIGHQMFLKQEHSFSF